MSSSDAGVDIAVVIPTYNRAALVGRAIESVLRQTAPPREIIVVDDGSTDGTPAEVARFGGAVRYIRQSNAGASEARNTGVRSASAPWIAFLDSDDFWRDSHLQTVGEAIRRSGGKAVLYFADMEMEKIDGGGSLWKHCGLEVRGTFELVEDGTEWVMMERQPMMLQTGVVSRAAYIELGGLWRKLRTRHDTHFFILVGIGRPLCAVAGIGTEQTSADDPSNRLMSASGPESLGYWQESVVMYEDLLGRCTTLPARHRRTLRERLGHAHWRLFRIAWKQRQKVFSVRELGRSLWSAPYVPLQNISRWIAQSLS